MSEHTKTPWAWHEADGEKWIFITGDSESCVVARIWNAVKGKTIDDEDRANALHIVHCVNNMSKVVEALRKVVAAEVTITYDPHEMFVRQHEANHQARALLAELEEGERGD